MKENDLLELLQSILEEDAIISRIYSYFVVYKNYTEDTLKTIVSYGVNKNIIEVIQTLDDSIIDHFSIDWKEENTFQELIFKEEYYAYYQTILFSEEPKIPSEFVQFITE